MTSSLLITLLEVKMQEPSISLKHFSHEHPLESNSHENRVRSACKMCRFSSLHKLCSDPNHTLTLSLSPDKQSRERECEACGRNNVGLYYSCIKCSLYYHTLCASELDSLNFICLCDPPSHHGWHYRCRLCEFDAHVSRAVKGHEFKSHQHELIDGLDQSTPVSEAFTLPSCQFSDGCFSLDLSKCNHQIQTQNEWSVDDRDHGNEKVQLLKRQSFSFGVRGLKRELSLAPSTGILTEVSEKSGPDNDNRKNRARDGENVNLRRPFWSKLLMCF